MGELERETMQLRRRRIGCHFVGKNPCLRTVVEHVGGAAISKNRASPSHTALIALADAGLYRANALGRSGRGNRPRCIACYRDGESVQSITWHGMKPSGCVRPRPC